MFFFLASIFHDDNHCKAENLVIWFGYFVVTHIPPSPTTKHTVKYKQKKRSSNIIAIWWTNVWSSYDVEDKNQFQFYIHCRVYKWCILIIARPQKRLTEIRYQNYWRMHTNTHTYTQRIFLCFSDCTASWMRIGSFVRIVAGVFQRSKTMYTNMKLKCIWK